jgi:hypothetical protein
MKTKNFYKKNLAKEKTKVNNGPGIRAKILQETNGSGADDASFSLRADIDCQGKLTHFYVEN